MRRSGTDANDAAIVVLVLVFGALCLAWVAQRALDMPEVRVDDLTGRCLEVRDPAAEHLGRAPYTCGCLPEAYTRTVVRGRR